MTCFMLMSCPACRFRCASAFDLSPCVLSQFDRDACQQSVCAWRPAASLEGQQTFTGELVVSLSCSWGLASYSYVSVLCITLTLHLYCCSIWPHVRERPDGHCTKVTKIWNGCSRVERMYHATQLFCYCCNCMCTFQLVSEVLWHSALLLFY